MNRSPNFVAISTMKYLNIHVPAEYCFGDIDLSNE